MSLSWLRRDIVTGGPRVHWYSGNVRVGWVAVVVACSISACSVDDRQLSVKSSDLGSGTPIPFTDGGPGLDGGDAALPFGGDGGGDGGSPGVTLPDGATLTPPDGGSGCAHVDNMGLRDCSQTLVANADFNRNVSGWVPDPGSKATWNSSDSQNAKTSGSLLVENDNEEDLDGMTVEGVGQCIAVTPGTTYDFAASIIVPKGQDYGSGQISAWFYDKPSCAGFVDQAYAVAGADSTAQWTAVSGSLIAPMTAASVMVRLVAQKPFREPKVQAEFDAVRVREH